MDRNRYIDNMPLEKARDIFFENIDLERKKENISTLDSLGRVTAQSIFAKRSSPDYCASAMDGILVFAEKVQDANEVNPVYLEEEIDFIYVNTGNQIDYLLGNAVIMIEDVIEQEKGKVKIYKNVKPFENIRPMGEDIIIGEMILKENHLIRPEDIGALISGGITELGVIKRPTVAIIPTGDEVIDIFKEEYKPGSVVDSNSYMFSALIKSWGGEPHILPRVKDEKDALKRNLEEAIEKYDIIIIGAGSSAGGKDFSRWVVEEVGELLVHGIDIKPGKPTILGHYRKKPILGIPGYPVSSYIAVDNFLKPLLEMLTGTEREEIYIEATLSKSLVSSLKHREFVRVVISKIRDEFIATPLSRGAGMTMSLAKADGILMIDKNSEGISGGTRVKVKLLKPLREIEDYLISIGRHDIIMDLIGDKIKLVSTHVGSFGGILSIKSRKTHIAPIHILDEKSGEYNIHILKKYFPEGDVALLKGIKRVQGILLEKGNPLDIRGIRDILRGDIKFVNRQRGSGTRVLLDYLLLQEEIDSKKIQGYQQERATHLEVGMAIKSGIANMGLGIEETANILDLNFIPLKDEEYDFLVLKDNLEEDKIKDFIEFLKSQYFQEEIEKMSGYKLSDGGKIICLK
ncbi:MAG: molybdopterin biosynthesis protein [Fusobacteriaceae bacterium]